MAYSVEGRLLEVCDCNALCPCWVGENPDNGTCKGTLARHFDKGHIDGVDVTGLTFGAAAAIPGNVLDGKWKVFAFIDDRATPEQQEAILALWSGKKGGPVADLAKLIGEIAGVEHVPITFEVREGKGHLRLGSMVEAEMEPFRGSDGRPTVLTDSVFSTIPGSPAYVGKAVSFRAKVPAVGIDVELSGHNAIQGLFHFSA